MVCSFRDVIISLIAPRNDSFSPFGFLPKFPPRPKKLRLLVPATGGSDCDTCSESEGD